jgi:DNA polymerase (family 10)
MTNAQIAAVIDEIGTLLELQGENAFRTNAYHNGARAIEQLGTDVSALVAEGKLVGIPGIGETLREKITTLVKTGALPFYDDLKAKTPPGLLQMLKVQGLGPKKVKALFDHLKVDDLDKLKTACEAGRVGGLKGFGAKTQQKILESIGFLQQTADRVRIDQAEAVAAGLLDALRDAPGVQRIEACGSLRRRKETIKDIDILVSANDAGPVMDRFTALPGVLQVLGRGDTKASVTVGGEAAGGGRVVMQADLRVVKEKEYAFALHYFTGSKQHNVALRGQAQDRGMKLNEYELTDGKKSIPCREEADLYRFFGMEYIPPELRENTGELEAAADGTLPTLVEVEDIQGVFHNHTTASDGRATLEEMAKAAKALGGQRPQSGARPGAARRHRRSQ